MMTPEYLRGLIGGVLIGVGALLVAGAAGKIAGISGMCSRVMYGRPDDRWWRALFIFGLVTGSGVTFALYPPVAVYHAVSSPMTAVVAGLLVGLGTRLGGGCTSGHGVCGLGLGSRESLVAVLVFIGAGMLVVWLVKHAGVFA